MNMVAALCRFAPTYLGSPVGEKDYSVGFAPATAVAWSGKVCRVDRDPATARRNLAIGDART
jgi:hypothetical protein